MADGNSFDNSYGNSYDYERGHAELLGGEQPNQGNWQDGAHGQQQHQQAGGMTVNVKKTTHKKYIYFGISILTASYLYQGIPRAYRERRTRTRISGYRTRSRIEYG